jgi:lipoprotein-anchoring transpeptidase ErfK/SrfK
VLALIAAAATGVAAIAPSGADESPLSLSASLSARKLTVLRGGEVVKVYDIAIGSGRHPTPTGSFAIHRIVWNPPWVPPDRKWAEGKTAQGPGDPDNPMKVVKIFFREPDFFIHGTAALGSLGQAASHGCLRMDPDDAGELALMVMENAGVSRDWDWVKGLLHMGDSHTVALRDPTRLVIEP